MVLKLDIVRYDRLRDPEECNRLNVDAYAVAKAKLVEDTRLSTPCIHLPPIKV